MNCIRRTSFLKAAINSTFTKRKLSDLQPVQLAYNVYESSNPKEKTRAPLIVNHGLFGSKSNWNSLCKMYNKKTGRKIIAVDARNHGDSPHVEQHSYEHLVADLKQLTEQLNLNKFILLGHSMGGRAVMYFALKYPNFVEKMIVVDISPVTTSPNLLTMPALFQVLQDVDLPKKGSLSVARLQVQQQLLEHFSDTSLINFLLTNLVQKPDQSYSWRINISTLTTNFNQVARFPPVENMTYSKDVLFVGGSNSDYIQESTHPDILKLFPKAEFQYIEDAGHWVHSEKPAEFLECTIKFLNRQ